MSESVDIDARGLKCPWPALRLARHMREYDNAVIVADDPVAPQEIAALANEHRWSLRPVSTTLGRGFRIEK